jgi:dipeptidyl aminopeptidase/acylaminoacyl peptidase
MSCKHSVWIGFILGAILWPSSGRTAPPAFTVEQVLSAPFPTDLVASPSGGKVAWIFDARGVRNVWAAEPPDYRGRQLTHYTEDDGLELTGLEWSPDGRTLVYARGGADLGAEYPNPRSLPRVPAQDVWVVSLDKATPRSVGEGHSPTIAPRGNRLVFLKHGQIWWAPLDGSAKATQLLQVRGSCDGLRWSPDGSKLAFVSNRREHSFVGVYDWSAKSIRWLDPSVDVDTNPTWSSDGKQLAFIRLPSGRPIAFGPRREGEPWSIRMADVSSGHGRQIWRADKGIGSVFRAVAAMDQLWWGAGDRLVFPWERTGWTHLYAVSLTGGSASLLTPGNFEVENVSLSPDRQEVLYSSNQNDIDRRHLWRVAVTGGTPTALTQGQGIEWRPVRASDGKAVAYFHSDARRPAQPAVKVGSAPARDLAPESVPATFPSTALVEPQAVLFSAADGLTIHGQLFLPRNLKKGERHPGVIFFHGGSRRQMLLGWHYMYYYHNTYALNQYLASRGYAVLSVNYRSGIGYGMEFREALHYGARGASEFNDVQGAGLWLRDRAEVDPRRIGVWGGSYGGYLTALGLARAPDLFAAGVDIHGVYDWNVTLRNFVSDYNPQAEQEAARLAFESSPVAAVKGWRAPVLVIHGDDDRNVPFRETVRLVADLRKQNVEVEQLIFPDEVHDFLTHARFVQAYQAAAEFFDRRLKGSGK